MKGNKYLSEAVDISKIKGGALNMIVAPCGSGKTHFAVNVLPQLVSAPHKMIYLIDTTIGKRQLLKKPNMKFYDKLWREAVCGEFVIYGEGQIVVMTYHHFGRLIEQYNGFAENFELILCDEIHNSIYFGNIQNRDEINHARKARDKIGQLIQSNPQIKVVGITATPHVNVKFECPINDIPVNEGIYEYETVNKIAYRNIHNLIPKLEKEKTGLIYTTHVKQMREIVKGAQSRGINAIAIWSINNEKDIMNDEQMTLWRHIVSEEELLPQYDLVAINASCGTAINIRSQVDYMIINSQISDTITQARGRVRRDLDTLHYLDKTVQDKVEIEVPLSFIGIPLYDTEKKLLCELIPVWDNRGRPRAWPSLKYHIKAAGYTVTTHQDRTRKSYDVINV